MSSESVEIFPNNWAYLKAELAWLDRILSVAIARQRQEQKTVERVAQSRADKVTSHWWKGLVALDSTAGYDETRPRSTQRSSTATSHQQQMEARIQASLQQGIALGLPQLRDRLKLTAFEKNLVLFSLAPEINRRYAKLYSYLESHETNRDARVAVEVYSQCGCPDLPTIDLVLRLLCRNDQEWQAGRAYLTANTGLVQQGLVQIVARKDETLLTRRLKLQDELVNYLLAEQPQTKSLELLLQSTRSQPAIAHHPTLPRYLHETKTPVDWTQLILPASLLESLQHIGQRVALWPEVQAIWSSSHPDTSTSPLLPGTVAVLVGAAGTGKTMAAAAIAQQLQTPLVWADLALVPPGNFARLLQEIQAHNPTVLLIKSAQLWLGRSSPLTTAEIHQLIDQRQQQRGITLLSVPLLQSVRWHWRQQIDQILEFSLPTPGDRLRLWHQVFPTTIGLDSSIDWEFLAHKLPLSGGEIRAIAQAATFYAATNSLEIKVTMAHILRAWEQKQQKLRTRS
ncbi:MAG TPA: AAA family ATPase [Allocoleopsis sp.]